MNGGSFRRSTTPGQARAESIRGQNLLTWAPARISTAPASVRTAPGSAIRTGPNPRPTSFVGVRRAAIEASPLTRARARLRSRQPTKAVKPISGRPRARLSRKAIPTSAVTKRAVGRADFSSIGTIRRHSETGPTTGAWKEAKAPARTRNGVVSAQVEEKRPTSAPAFRATSALPAASSARLATTWMPASTRQAARASNTAQVKAGRRFQPGQRRTRRSSRRPRPCRPPAQA